MNFRYAGIRRRMLIALIVLVICAFYGQNTTAATRLGLHVTKELLTKWRDRAKNGPYKSVGDVSSGSPGGWDRIVWQKDNWYAEGWNINYWSGPTNPGGCLSDNYYTPSGEQTFHSRQLKDAAFYALIKEDATIKANVRDWIINQTHNYPNVDWTDRTLWCLGILNSERLFYTSEWLTNILYAYDYISILDSGAFTTQEHTNIQAWFNGFAEFQKDALDRDLGKLFQDRYGGDYTPTYPVFRDKIPYYGSCIDPGTSCLLSTYHKHYNNRRSGVAKTIGLIGILLNNSTYITTAELYVKEYLKFAVFDTDGYESDFYRWSDGPDTGYIYSLAALGHCMDLALALAFTGDTELFNYSTSDGIYGSAGGTKTLLTAATHLGKYADGTYERYGTDQSQYIGNPAYRINLVLQNGTHQTLDDHFLAPGNLYLRDSYIASIYQRTAAGTVEYDAYTWQNEDKLQGAGWNYPNVLFMFGQMEGQVWPIGSSSPPDTPKNLRITQGQQ